MMVLSRQWTTRVYLVHWQPSLHELHVRCDTQRLAAAEPFRAVVDIERISIQVDRLDGEEASYFRSRQAVAERLHTRGAYLIVVQTSLGRQSKAHTNTPCRLARQPASERGETKLWCCGWIRDWAIPGWL
jgi:hypothetical protein